MAIDRGAHTLAELMDVLDTVFAGERGRTSKQAERWWNRFYDDPLQPAPFLTDAPDESLARWLDDHLLPESGRALDLGCGIGRNAIHLASHGFTVDAADLSPVAINRTRQLADLHAVRVNARVLDVIHQALPTARCTLIHDSGLFHHLPPHRRLSYLTLLDQALLPGGYFSLTCFGANNAEALIPDAELYRRGDLGGGLLYPPEALRSIFEHLEEIELRPMSDEPPSSRLFGSHSSPSPSPSGPTTPISSAKMRSARATT